MKEMEPETRRRPRFRRVSTPRFELTPRDVEIIRHVGKHRFLRSSHLAELTDSPLKKINTRLSYLFHNHFLDRPAHQVAYYRVGGGSRPIIYGLGNAGADLLAREFGVPRSKVDWTAKNREAGSEFLHHTLLVADVLVGLELACRAHPTIELIERDELFNAFPEATQRKPRPFSWRARVSHEGTIQDVPVEPDGIFGLRYTDRPEGRNRAYFFLEADRGTMPVKRSSLLRTSFHRKLLAYFTTWQRKLHTEHFGFKNFRVLTVTKGAERAKNIREAAAEVTRGTRPGLFLFSHHGAILEGDALSVPWANIDGQTVHLAE